MKPRPPLPPSDRIIQSTGSPWIFLLLPIAVMYLVALAIVIYHLLMGQ